MKDQDFVYNQLVEVACSGKVVSYQDVAAWLGKDFYKPEDHAEVLRILGEIDCQENAAGRPLLTAVVVLPEIRYPDSSFFRLARGLGFNNFEDWRSFYWHELSRVHAYWKMHIPAPQGMPYIPINRQEVRVIVS